MSADRKRFVFVFITTGLASVLLVSFVLADRGLLKRFRVYAYRLRSHDGFIRRWRIYDTKQRHTVARFDIQEKAEAEAARLERINARESASETGDGSTGRRTASSER